MPFRTYALLIAIVLAAGGASVAIAALSGFATWPGAMALSGTALVLAGLGLLRLFTGTGGGK